MPWRLRRRRKAKAEVACLEVERTSLLLEIGTAKDEVSSLYSQAGKDKEAMEEDYYKALELIFAVTPLLQSDPVGGSEQNPGCH